MKGIIIFALASLSLASATTVQFYSEKTCQGGVRQEFRVGCNTCIDPEGDFQSTQITDIGAGQRVSVHNQDGCTSASQVGQWYGSVCASAGATALRSVWVSC
ncbi:MAG: hypothetical protein JOS17DRAFT_731316 [Linnemannia elongata]|nr:MAG: hypothetical protein JOS17DRAFT_731316 [Linnemannia elongata]